LSKTVSIMLLRVDGGELIMVLILSIFFSVFIAVFITVFISPFFLIYSLLIISCQTGSMHLAAYLAAYLMCNLGKIENVFKVWRSKNTSFESSFIQHAEYLYVTLISFHPPSFSSPPIYKIQQLRRRVYSRFQNDGQRHHRFRHQM
jgi:hypothetical protein